MKPWRRRLYRQLLITRREVKRFVAIAERRAAAAAEKPPDVVRFRLLWEAEAEAIVGGELLAALAAGTGVVVETSPPH
jgi:hypothetical protein